MALFDFLKKKNIDESEVLSESSEDIEELDRLEDEEELDDLEKLEEFKEFEEETLLDTDETTEEKTDKIAEDHTEETAEEKAEDDETSEEENTTDETVDEAVPKQGFFAKIKAGLTKTRDNIMSGVDNVLKSFVKVDEELFEELEETLIMADIGVETSVYIIDQLRDKVKSNRITDTADVKNALEEVISEILEKDEEPLDLPVPSVILVIGVNGVGKTTTIGKLAHNYMGEGKSVLLAAADTFRAAAIDQLQIWGDRNGCDVIKHQENSDPGAVVFDAVQAAKARKTDLLICDTAGRLHNKKNLMNELKKIAGIIEKEYPQAHTEVFLVLDATTGQNAIQQAKLFNDVADISGIVLTKLDGTAKGGIVLAIKNEMNIPVRFVGVGEGIDDLQPFSSKDFARALFEE